MRKCKKFLEYMGIIHRWPTELAPIVFPWPFAQWVVDLVGPLPQGKGGVKFVVLAMVYLTKWVEAEVLAMITTNNISCFLWKSIVCWFGVPCCIVLDNGRQFDSDHY